MSGEEDNFFFEGVECVRLLAARLTRARARARACRRLLHACACFACANAPSPPAPLYRRKVLEIDFLLGDGRESPPQASPAPSASASASASTSASGPPSPSARGLRGLSRAQIDELCAAAKCTVISSASNAFFDAYVLSESSLFVYPSKIVLKTCGTTTLLVAVEPLLKAAAGLGLSLEWCVRQREAARRQRRRRREPLQGAHTRAAPPRRQCNPPALALQGCLHAQELPAARPAEVPAPRPHRGGA